MVTGEQRPQRPHPATATEAQTHAAADGVLRGRSVFEAGGDDGDLQIEVNHLDPFGIHSHFSNWRMNENEP